MYSAPCTSIRRLRNFSPLFYPSWNPLRRRQSSASCATDIGLGRKNGRQYPGRFEFSRRRSMHRLMRLTCCCDHRRSHRIDFFSLNRKTRDNARGLCGIQEQPQILRLRPLWRTPLRMTTLREMAKSGRDSRARAAGPACLIAATGTFCVRLSGIASAASGMILCGETGDGGG